MFGEDEKRLEKGVEHLESGKKRLERGRNVWRGGGTFGEGEERLERGRDVRRGVRNVWRASCLIFRSFEIVLQSKTFSVTPHKPRHDVCKCLHGFGVCYTENALIEV